MATRARAIVIAALLVGGVFIAGRVWRDRRGSSGSADATTGSQHSDLIAWEALADAPRLSAEGKKPILYDFNAAWCGPCRQLDRAVFSDEEAARFINDHYIPVSVVDRQEEEGRNPPEIDALQRRYEVPGFPTLVIADAEGSPKGKIIGYAGKDRTIAFLKQTR